MGKKSKIRLRFLFDRQRLQYTLPTLIFTLLFVQEPNVNPKFTLSFFRASVTKQIYLYLRTNDCIRMNVHGQKICILNYGHFSVIFE